MTSQEDFKMLAVRKKNVLSLNKKMEVINSKERENLSVLHITKKFNIGKSQFYEIMKHKEKIKEEWLKGNGEMKRKRKSGNEEINEMVWEWFIDVRSRNLPISGPMIQAQAKQIAERLNNRNFHASNGWLESFRKRHAIKIKRTCRDAVDVPPEIVNDWLEELLATTEGYELKDIANGDETGLFFRALPDKTLGLKGEKCAGGKLSKERLTVFFCAFMTGEKEKPLVIGKSAKPCCFENLDMEKLPFDWRSNEKAWMTSKIMQEWLLGFNTRMKNQNRKVLLFLDNASCHPHIKLSNVKLAWIPTNTTNVTQPMGQGIIRDVKTNYRCLLVQSSLANMRSPSNSTKLIKPIKVLDSLMWLTEAWQKVSTETIGLCFSKANFPGEFNPDEEVYTEIEALQNMLDQGKFEINALNYVTMDDQLATEAPLDELEKTIINLPVNEDDKSSSDEEVIKTDNDLKINSYQCALECINNLWNFAAFKGDAELLGVLNNARTITENRIVSMPFVVKTEF